MGAPSLPPLGPPNLANGDSGLGGQNDYAKWAEMRPYLRNLVVADYNARFYGAKGDGVANDTLALLAAIADAGVTKGRVFLPAGIYNVDTTVALGNGSNGVASTINGVEVYGEGIWSTTIRWIGAVGGTVAAINGQCNGNMFAHLTIDGNGTAANGLLITAGMYAHCPAIRVVNTTSGALILDAWAGAAFNQNSQGLSFGQVYLQCAPGTVSVQSHGLWLRGTGAWDTSQCSFANLHVLAQNDYNTGVRLGFCDLNVFGSVTVFHFSATNPVGLHIDGVVAGFPKGNSFAVANFDGPLLTTGTPGTNPIGYYATEDASMPVPGFTSGIFGLSTPVNQSVPLATFGQGGPVNIANEVINSLLISVAATNLAQVANPVPGLYMAQLYFRVTGAAAVTVSAAAYTGDETGTQFFVFEGIKSGGGAGGAVYIAMNSAVLAQGFSYSCAPIPLRWSAGQAPVINIQASIANVVFVTASIVKVG